MSKYKSVLSTQVIQCNPQIRGGTLLCVDPSSGSLGSLPGYAVFKKGLLVDAGIIALPRGTRAIANRLWQLHRALHDEFEQPDLLAVEWIAPVFPTAKGRDGRAGHFTHKSASSLTKSVGAIMSVWDVPTIEPTPATWHSITPPGYVKSDCHDAQMLGWACLTVLARVLGEPDPVIHLLSPGGSHV